MYRFHVRSHWYLTPPICSPLTPLHVHLFSVSLPTSSCASLLLSELLLLCLSYFRHPDLSGTLPASPRQPPHVFFRPAQASLSSPPHQTTQAGPTISSLSRTYNTRSSIISLSDQESYYRDQRAVSLLRENGINIVNSASLLPLLSLHSHSHLTSHVHPEQLLLHKASTSSIFAEGKADELISLLCHPSISKCSSQNAISSTAGCLRLPNLLTQQVRSAGFFCNKR